MQVAGIHAKAVDGIQKCGELEKFQKSCILLKKRLTTTPTKSHSHNQRA